MSINDQIASHYTTANALELLDQRLREQGIDPQHPTLEALAPFDNFHSRGAAATNDQIELAGFPTGARVLDVGGGLGGPARTLASRANVHVTVLDLTPSFVEQGRTLTARLGMSDLVDFEVGDGTAMPFAAASFDGVWTQHSTMNIQNKEALFGEIHRVLKPGGRLVMHEVVAGNGAPIDYPLPWASTAELSDMRSASALRSLIGSAGFRELFWEDESAPVLAFMQRMRDSPPLGRAAMLGPAFQERLQNFNRNLEAGNVAVMRALFERTP